MIESDQNDKDNLNDSLDSNEHTKKRPCKESSDNDNEHLFPKKLCTSDDKITFEETNLDHKSEINGSVANIKEEDTGIVEGEAKDTDVCNSMEDAKDTSISTSKEDAKSIDSSEELLCNAKSENENKEVCIVNNVREIKTEKSTDDEYKDGIPVGSEINVNTKEVIAKNEETGEDEENKKPKKKRDKSQVEDAEVVEGLELSVECASDKESSSSSESEIEKDRKPKPKTIIIKAKPNDSELDVSSSEAEKSDLQDVTAEVKPKQNTKKGKRKARTSFSKPPDGDSEENDDVSDEDYSPRTKRKLKKTQANKKKSSSELKGSSRDRAKKMDQQLDEKVKEEEENSDTVDDKDTEESSSMKKMTPSDRRIEMLKTYIKVAGIRVKSYSTVWAGCKSNAAKIRCLEEVLEKYEANEAEKCKKAKKRNEKLKDIAELNTSNIISEGRVTRAQRKRETPTEHRQARTTLKAVLRVVDSDSE